MRGQWARRTPERPIRARVQGVELTLPSTHPLRFYARLCPAYSQNLVDIGAGIAEVEGRLVLLDVGANIGDSTAQVHARVRARSGELAAVCVEPDPRWLPYLRTNTGPVPGTEIEESLLTWDAADPTDADLVAVPHKAGTTQYLRVVDDRETGGLATMSVADLLARHDVLRDVRLVKSDTDGYDVALAPHYARVFAASRPVLFLEFDARLSRTARPDHDPHALWDELAALGYTDVGIWDNFNVPLGRLPIEEMRAAGERVDADGGFTDAYWDVAVAHGADATALAVLSRLNPAWHCGAGQTC